MKKTYNKPNMEIVSFATENIASGELSQLKVENLQKDFQTINYY